MKPIHLFLGLLVALAAGAVGWFASKHFSSTHAGGEATTVSDVVYTCSMHPQVRQNKPGTCPFCGMTLAPLNAGGASNLPAGSVMLSSNRVNAIHVQTVAVKRRPLQRTLRVAGIIDDNDARHRFMSAYVDGRIDRLFVNFVGAEVQAGQPLATFYSPMLLAAEREYVSLAKRMAGAKDAGSSVVHDEHERLLAGARQRLVQLGLAPSQIAALPDKPADAVHTELLAPISGTVVGRMAYEGLYVKEGEKLFEIADFATMWFRFDAYERDLAWLQPGQDVEVTTPSVPGKVFKAPLSFIDPNLNEPTRSAKVRVELTNAIVQTNGQMRRELLHKIYAEGVVHIAVPEVPAIPRSAVLAPGRPYVFVDQGNGVYEQRHIKLGRAGDELWEVLEGLQDGERVVTSGNLLIDSQAQLDNSGAAHAPDPGSDSLSSSPAVPSGEPLSPLAPGQLTAVTNFLGVTAGITTALAGDNLSEFNRLSEGVHDAVARLVATLTNDGWSARVRPVEATAHWTRAADLKAARQSFHPFTMATAELALAVRRQTNLTELRIYQCPMVKQAFPNAPRTGRWIQLRGEIRNPYFGAEMLDCGTEIKP